MCCSTSGLKNKGHWFQNPGVNTCGSRVGTFVPNETGSGAGTGNGPPGVNTLEDDLLLEPSSSSETKREGRSTL